MEFKTVSIIGMGAVGAMYGQALADALPEGTVRFVMDEARAARHREKGIYINGRHRFFPLADTRPGQPPADLLIFATKAVGLDKAIEDARPQVGPNTVVISLLNGISSEEHLAGAYGPEKVLYCVVQGMDATMEANRVAFNTMGFWRLGEKDNSRTPRLAAVAKLLDTAGIAYEIPDDILRMLWNKFMLNCGINQVAMVYQTGYGGALAPGPARTTLLAAMQEVRAISQKAGIHLTQQDIDDWIKVLGTLAPKATPSMRQDALAKRKTEVELFSGTARRLGRQYGVPTPVNDRLYSTIRRMEAEY